MVILSQEDNEQEIRICTVFKNEMSPDAPFVQEYKSLALLGQYAQND